CFSINDTKLNSVIFLQTRLPSHRDAHIWISIPFCFIYVISIVGNSVILFIVKTDPRLHEPIYIFLSMLAITDLGISIMTIPMILGIYFLDACLAQLFFIHVLHCIESSVLLLMAFDRFIVIYNPLRYTSILILPRIAKMGLMAVVRATVIILPLPFLLKRFQYCGNNVLSHSYCVHREVMKMACSDITVNIIYRLFTKLFQMGLDLLLIFLSYVMILKTVLSIGSHEEYLRVLNTCVSHLCHPAPLHTRDHLDCDTKFEKGSLPLLQIVLGYISLLLPLLINPIVYSVKGKHLRERIIWVFIK
uniref:Olfactory receptor n=1 Tax=Gopherus evgoodei TaxID=1825980 RepID=A0A8C4WIF2_9SAUR